MLQVRSWIKIVDNTGARSVSVFSVGGKNKNRYARVGDIVVGSVKQADPNSGIKKGDKVYALIIRTKKEMRRKDGSYIRFTDNAGVIVSKESGEPKGTRIFGPMPREIREKAVGEFEDGFKKILSLAPEVI